MQSSGQFDCLLVIGAVPLERTPDLALVLKQHGRLLTISACGTQVSENGFPDLAMAPLIINASALVNKCEHLHTPQCMFMLCIMNLPLSTVLQVLCWQLVPPQLPAPAKTAIQEPSSRVAAARAASARMAGLSAPSSPSHSSQPPALAAAQHHVAGSTVCLHHSALPLDCSGPSWKCPLFQPLPSDPLLAITQAEYEQCLHSVARLIAASGVHLVGQLCGVSEALGAAAVWHLNKEDRLRKGQAAEQLGSLGQVCV